MASRSGRFRKGHPMRSPSSFVTAAVLVTALAGASYGRLRRPAVITASTTSGDTSAPELNNTSWLNAGHPLRLAELRGRVALLNFWVFTCYNCTNTVPSLVAFDRSYRARGDRKSTRLNSSHEWIS